jgi:glycosyl transferase family 2
MTHGHGLAHEGASRRPADLSPSKSADCLIADRVGEVPWLTIVMPTFCTTKKVEQWFDATLRSLTSEPADGIEILMIDSSPTPAARDIAKRYEGRLNLSIFNRPDLSMWHTKTNFGVGIARAKHISWLHTDDLWLPGRAAAVRSWIAAAPLLPLHIAPCAIIDRDGANLGTWWCPFSKPATLPSQSVAERLLVQNFIAAPAPVFRKDAWEKCGGLDATLWYTADWDIWLKLAAIGPVGYHDEVTTAFRVHGNSLTVGGTSDLADFERQMQIVFDRHLPQLNGRGGRRSRMIAQAGRASIAVNTALAAASTGSFRRLPSTGTQLLRLGPAGLWRYWHCSRIGERLLPRIRARLRGAM